MKVAVITPYHTEPLDMLKRAHDSVAAQTHSCTHYMVADGHPREELNDWDVRHIPLPVEHNNNGNTPRAIGCLDAMGDRFDAIAFLDTDNWFEPNHVENLLALQHETGADFVSSGRVIHAIDGTVLLADGEEKDGIETTDTSSLLFTRSTFAVLPLWGSMPNELGPNCDRFIFKGVQSLGCQHAHSRAPTLHFTSRYGPHYRAAGVEVPPEAVAMNAKKDSDVFARRLGAKGLSFVLSGHDAKDWFAKKAATPVIIVSITAPNSDHEAQDAFCTSLNDKLGADSEQHHLTVSQLQTHTGFTDTHNNVFAVYFERGDKEERTMLETVAQERGDIAIIYVRPREDAAAEVATLLDRYAWRIVVPSQQLSDRYHQHSRYGNGHVLVSSTQHGVELVADHMRAYAR